MLDGTVSAIQRKYRINLCLNASLGRLIVKASHLILGKKIRQNHYFLIIYTKTEKHEKSMKKSKVP